MDDTKLYQRGIETLVASWEANARGASGAAVLRSPGVAVAVFPNEPERAVYNNALLARDLGTASAPSQSICWRLRTRQASPTLRYGCTRATRRCAPI